MFFFTSLDPKTKERFPVARYDDNCALVVVLIT